MTSLKRLLSGSRHIILYGALMAFMVFVLKWLQWKYLITDYSLDIYVGLIAVFFTLLGLWVATQLARPEIRTVVAEKSVVADPAESLTADESAAVALHLTVREREVLQLLKHGYSNAEIADRLFLSLSTVKTHVSNLYAKMEVKNRVQAVQKAKSLKIIA